MTSQGRLRHRSCEGQHGQAAVLELGQAHLLLTLLESPTVGQERMVLYILSVNVIKSQESNLSTKKYQFRWLNPPGSILAFIHCRPVFSETLPVSWPYTFSALPFPILVTGEQTGKAIVASHLNGVPLEDLLGAAELQDADPEEDLGRVAYLISIFWRIDYITCYLASSVCFFEGFRAHPHLPVPRLSIDASGTKESIVGINRHRHCLERELLACRPLS